MAAQLDHPSRAFDVYVDGFFEIAIELDASGHVHHDRHLLLKQLQILCAYSQFRKGHISGDGFQLAEDLRLVLSQIVENLHRRGAEATGKKNKKKEKKRNEKGM